MPTVFNDGVIPYGSRLVGLTGSLGESVGWYVAESISVTRPTIAVHRSNELGEPVAAVYIQDWVTGDMTLQLPNTGSRIPVPGFTFRAGFTGSLAANGYDEKFVINSVSQPESNTTDKKVTCQFTKVIN